VADTINAIYWNPAGLATLEGKEISATHTNILGGLRVANIEAGKAGMGLEVNALYVEEVRRDAATGDTTGTFMDNNTSVAFGYAKKVNDSTSIGGNLKAIQMTLDTVSASGIAVDIGGLFTINEKLKAGVVLQNLGTAIKFEGDEAGGVFK